MGTNGLHWADFLAEFLQFGLTGLEGEVSDKDTGGHVGFRLGFSHVVCG